MVDFDVLSWRDRVGLSQQKLAEALGCSKTSVVKWERAKRAPRYIALACAAWAYGLKPVTH